MGAVYAQSVTGPYLSGAGSHRLIRRHHRLRQQPPARATHRRPTNRRRHDRLARLAELSARLPGAPATTRLDPIADSFVGGIGQMTAARNGRVGKLAAT
jgi:hypothetical protein